MAGVVPGVVNSRRGRRADQVTCGQTCEDLPCLTTPTLLLLLLVLVLLLLLAYTNN